MAVARNDGNRSLADACIQITPYLMFQQRDPVDPNQSAWFSAVERSQRPVIVFSEDDCLHVREVLPDGDRALERLGTTRALLITANHVSTRKNAKIVKGGSEIPQIPQGYPLRRERKHLGLKFGEKLVEPEI